MGVLDPVCGFGPYVNQHNCEGSRRRGRAWPTPRTAPTWQVQVRTGRSVSSGVERLVTPSAGSCGTTVAE